MKVDEEIYKVSNLESGSNSLEISFISIMWEGVCKKEENEDDVIFG